MLKNKRESSDLKYLNDLKAISKYSIDLNENIEEYNPNKKQKILLVFDDMIFDMLSNKKTSSNSDWNNH